MQATELCQAIPTMPNCPRCLSIPVKPSRLQATSRFWLGAGGWRLLLVVVLGLGIVMEAGAGFAKYDPDKELGLIHKWEELGLLTVLEDRSKKTQLAAEGRLESRPTQNDAIIKLILEWLQKPETRLYALIVMGNFNEAYHPLAPRVAASLEDPDDLVRCAAIGALSIMGADAIPYAKQFADRLSDSNSQVRQTALYALGNMGEAARPYGKQIVGLLRDQSAQVRKIASEALRKISAQTNLAGPFRISSDKDKPAEVIPKPEHLPAVELVTQLQSKDYEISGQARATLTKLDTADLLPIMPKLAELLERSDHDGTAAALLGKLGVAAKPYAPKIAKHLVDEGYGIDTYRIALFRLGPFDDPEMRREIWMDVLAAAEVRCESRYKLRVDAYLLFGQDADLLTATAWLGKRQVDELPDIGKHDQTAKIQAVNALRIALHYPDRQEFHEVAKEAAENIVRLVDSGGWKLDDVAWLEGVRLDVQNNQPSLALDVDKAMERIQLWRIVRGLLLAGLGHAAFWSVLIVLYPRYRIVQSLVFRHRWFRRFFGLGYVSVLLTIVPSLRRRLFAPFRDVLVPPGALGNFDEASYFQHCQLVSKTHTHHAPENAHTLLEPLRGQHVIEATSGLGKTTLLRHLALQSRQYQPAVLLRAVDCSEGVLPAIQKRLQGHARDEQYLRDLVYVGALDIFIDGLNEAPPDTRARIAQFFQESFSGNFVLTTQPLVWDAPLTARVWELQPLAVEEVEEFMRVQWPRLQPSAKIEEDRYTLAVRDLLAGLREQAGQHKAIAAERLRMLCNPMECVFAAELLAAGLVPEPGLVLAQIYRLMVEEFQAKRGIPFPEQRFAERVFNWRQSGEPYVDMQGFEHEALALEKHKLMRKLAVDGKEEVGPWVFRHDKVMDFFLLPAFCGEHKERRYDVVADGRFSGVYDLLAGVLAGDEADALWRFLAQHAAKTGDHTVFDRYTQLCTFMATESVY